MGLGEIEQGQQIVAVLDLIGIVNRGMGPRERIDVCMRHCIKLYRRGDVSAEFLRPGLRSCR